MSASYAWSAIDRLIEDVVLVVRLLDPLPQLGGPLLRGRRGHAPILAQPPRS